MGYYSHINNIIIDEIILKIILLLYNFHCWIMQIIKIIKNNNKILLNIIGQYYIYLVGFKKNYLLNYQL